MSLPLYYIPRAQYTFELQVQKVDGFIGRNDFNKTPNTIGVKLTYPPNYSLSISSTIVVMRQDLGIIEDLSLSIEFNTQTQFNIFNNPSHSALIINGVEYHNYDIVNVAGNWRLRWTGDFLLQTTDTLIFRTFKI